MKRPVLISIVVCLLLAQRQTVIAETITVDVQNPPTVFDPSSITIHAGDTVDWHWGAGVGFHSTMSDMSLWNSGVQSGVYDFSHEFSSAGDFSYRDSVTGQTGTVDVLAAEYALLTLRSSVEANDTINWSTKGNPGAILASGFSVASLEGVVRP